MCPTTSIMKVSHSGSWCFVVFSLLIIVSYDLAILMCLYNSSSKLCRTVQISQDKKKVTLKNKLKIKSYHKGWM